MACCLTLALMVALVRKLRPVRGDAAAFAPPAYRSGLPTGPGALGSETPVVEVPSRQPLSAGGLLWFGLIAGTFAYLVDVVVLTAWGTLLADLTVRVVLAAFVGLFVALRWPSTVSRLQPSDTPLVVGIAGLAFGLLGLLEMHVLGTISFVSPSISADLVFHFAGPLLASCAAVALLHARAPSLLGER